MSEDLYLRGLDAAIAQFVWCLCGFLANLILLTDRHASTRGWFYDLGGPCMFCFFSQALQPFWASAETGD